MYATIVIDRDGGERLLGHESDTLSYHHKRARGWINAADANDVAVEVRRNGKTINRREVVSYCINGETVSV
jgi:hypothetical protein